MIIFATKNGKAKEQNKERCGGCHFRNAEIGWELFRRRAVPRRYALALLTASTPSPINCVAKPARRNRVATSLGTSRPLVSLLGLPV